MPDPSLLRAFRFRIQLMRSPQAAEGASDVVGPAPAGGGAGGGASFGIGASFSASVSLGVSLGGSAGGSLLGSGAFAECSGLDLEMEVVDYLEGGRNDSVIRRAGRARYHPLILKRGMVYGPDGVNGELWTWIQNVVGGVRPIPRYDGIVEVMSVADTVSARWVFTRGLPARIGGPQLNAKTGEVAVEELQIAHEGLRMVPV